MIATDTFWQREHVWKYALWYLRDRKQTRLFDAVKNAKVLIALRWNA